MYRHHWNDPIPPAVSFQLLHQKIYSLRLHLLVVQTTSLNQQRCRSIINYHETGVGILPTQAL
jgi:hypothetical protein